MITRIALSLILSIFAFAANAGQSTCDGCDIYESTTARGKTPYNGPLICLNYVQTESDKVVVSFMKGGTKVHGASNATGPRDRFCFGSWRFTRADVKPDEIWFCNGTKSARLVSGDIEKVVLHKGMPAYVSVCLLGSEKCDGKAILVEKKQ